MLADVEKDKFAPTPEKTELIALCATRWVERHDSVLTFRLLVSFIVTALDISWNETFSAYTRRRIRDFLVSLEIVGNLFLRIKTLGVVDVQSPRQDLSDVFPIFTCKKYN